MKAKCPVCNRIVGAVNPKGGDGTAVKIRKHDREIRSFQKYGPHVTLEVCEGSYTLVNDWEDTK